MNRALRAVLILVTTPMLIACHDASPPPASPTAPAEAQASVTREAGTPKRRVTAAEFHAQNKMDWVGVAHNRAMDEFRAEIRRSKPKDLCEAIERVAVDLDLTSGRSSELSKDEARRIRRAGFDVSGCRGHRKESGAAASHASILSAGYSRAALKEVDLSAAGWDLVNQVSAAADASSTSGDLASALAPISAAAQSLGDEASVVDAVASIALSSFEYWEQNGTAAATAVGSSYDACLGAGGGESCFYATRFSSPYEPLRAPVFLASNRVSLPAGCSFNWKWVGGADVAGAVVAIPIALKFALVPSNAVLGILAAGVGVSAGAFVAQTAQFYWCLYHE